LRDCGYVFPDFAARAKRLQVLSQAALAELARTTTADTKEALPWLKLARFGYGATPRGSLRHDRNVICITGIEGDYDGGVVAFDEALEQLAKAGLLALVYTSPSHSPPRPRWRVLCPTSTELPPSARLALVGRLNGVLHGVPLLAAKARLEAVFDDVFSGDRDDRWRARRASIPTMLLYVYPKEASKRADEEQAVYAGLPKELRRLIAEGVEGEQRKREIARLAGLLIPRVEIYGALDLLLAWNTARCRPPLPTAEVFSVVEWIAEREIERTGGANEK
jgi:hypothetical protein